MNLTQRHGGTEEESAVGTGGIMGAAIDRRHSPPAVLAHD